MGIRFACLRVSPTAQIRRTSPSRIIYGHLRTARLRRQEQGLRPAPFLRPAADDPGQWRRPAHQSAAHGAQGRARHGVRHHERCAAQALRREPRVRFLLRHPQSGALPRQRLRPEPRRRSGDADHSFQGAYARGAEGAVHLQGNLRSAARHRAGDRPDRIGQVHHAGGHGQPHQRERITATSSPSRTRSSSCTRARSA